MAPTGGQLRCRTQPCREDEANEVTLDEVDEVTLEVSADCRRVRIGCEELEVHNLDAFSKEWVVTKIEEQQRLAAGRQAKTLGAILAKLKREMRFDELDKEGDAIINHVKAKVQTYDLSKDEAGEQDRWEIEDMYEEMAAEKQQLAGIEDSEDECDELIELLRDLIRQKDGDETAQMDKGDIETVYIMKGGGMKLEEKQNQKVGASVKKDDQDTGMRNKESMRWVDMESEEEETNNTNVVGTKQERKHKGKSRTSAKRKKKMTDMEKQINAMTKKERDEMQPD